MSRGSTVASLSAAAGRMRLTRRTDTRPAISANTIPAPAAMSTTTGLVQAWGEGGSSWCAARPRSPQFASHRPGRYAARPATAPSTASSSQIMRRTWPGVAPTARSRARLRQRRAIDSAMVPATTKNAMATTATPAFVASCSRPSLSVPTARSSAWPIFPGPSTVRSEPPSAAWTRPASVAADTPGRATMPIRSACPGWPYSAAASASDTNTVQSPAGLAPLAAATPTTVKAGRSWPASRTADPIRNPVEAATPEPRTIWLAVTGACPLARRNGVSAALAQPCAWNGSAAVPVATFPLAGSRATWNETSGTAAATPSTEARRLARPSGTRR